MVKCEYCERPCDDSEEWMYLRFRDVKHPVHVNGCRDEMIDLLLGQDEFMEPYGGWD
jgi:hypothetical protein